MIAMVGVSEWMESRACGQDPSQYFPFVMMTQSGEWTPKGRETIVISRDGGFLLIDRYSSLRFYTFGKAEKFAKRKLVPLHHTLRL